MRKIGASAGVRNHYAVQYYFKDKEGLARAILLARRSSLEGQHLRLLEELGSSDRLTDPFGLMNAYLMPFALETDANGRHTFAGFVINLLWNSSVRNPSMVAQERAPLAVHIRHLLLRCANTPDEVAQTRLRICLVAFLHAVILVDREGQHLSFPERITRWEDTIRMLVQGYISPYEGPELAE